MAAQGLESPARLMLYDADGVAVLRHEGVRLPYTLSIEDLPAGSYVLHVTATAFSATAKLLVSGR